MQQWTDKEFWATLISAIIGLLTVLGVIGPDDHALVTAITGAVLIVGPATAYIIMTIVKKNVETKAAATVEAAKVDAEARIGAAKLMAKAPSAK